MTIIKMLRGFGLLQKVHASSPSKKTGKIKNKNGSDENTMD